MVMDATEKNEAEKEIQPEGWNSIHIEISKAHVTAPGPAHT